MKNIIAFILFASPFVINAQEPVKENKGTKTPPSSEKSISEKGVSSTKGRGITVKKSQMETAPTQSTTTEPKKTEDSKSTKNKTQTTNP